MPLTSTILLESREKKSRDSGWEEVRTVCVGYRGDVIFLREEV